MTTGARRSPRLSLFGFIMAAAVLASPSVATAQCPDLGVAFVSTPASQTIAPGATVTMSVTTAPGPPGCFDFHWYEGASGDFTHRVLFGTGRNTLTTPPLTATQNYWVRAVYFVHPSAEMITYVANSGTVTITVPAPARIVTQPQSQSVNPGTTATLSVGAIGPDPQTYQWYVGASGNTSTPIAGATASSYTTPALSANTNYWVRVSNPYGPADSDTATITIGVTPAVTTQPQSQVIFSGSTTTLTVAASGSPTLTYQWYVGPSGNISSPIPGATASSYTTPPLTTDTNYWVRVSNPYGTTDSATATITIGVAPSITSHPPSQTVCSGTSVTLHVDAMGTTPFSYQWYVGMSGDTSSPIGGGNDRSTPFLVTTTSYWVRVSNPYGTMDSDTATITIPALSVAPQSIPFGPAGGNGSAGVTLGSACSWNASTSASWIALDVSDGNGDGTLTFFAQPNTTGASRSASITIRSGVFSGADQTVLVTELLTGGDFNGDGKADVAWRNSATGQNIGWLMNGTTVGMAAFLPTIADTNWSVAGIGDFDHDGKADVIWRNTMTGQNIGWLMNGLTITSAGFLPTIAGTSWEISGVGDFDGNGRADVIWRNNTTGQDVGWLMNGLTVANSAFLPTIADTNWAIAGVGDFDGDGKADVVLRNKATGQDIGWLMNGLMVANSAFLPTIADTNWAITGVGDFDGDGKADVVLRHGVTGQDIGWLMNGLTVASSAFLPTIADTNWAIIGVGDFDGDGKADVVLRHKVSGQNIGWLMNGLTVATSAFLSTIADANWNIVGP